MVFSAVAFSWFWISMLSLQNLMIPIMLASYDNQVPATAIWSLYSNGTHGRAAALAMVLVALVGLLGVILHRYVSARVR